MNKGTVGFVFVDVWITTGGTMNSVMSRFTGEACRDYEQQKKGKIRTRLIGFAKLSHDELDNIRQQSYNIYTLHEEVRRRSSAYVRYCVQCFRLLLHRLSLLHIPQPSSY